MLLLDLFDHAGEKKFHLVLHGTKLRYLGVGVLVKDVLDFRPFHFFTGLMKQSTLLPVIESVFANEARLTALGIHTDHQTRIAIDAFRQIFEVFTSHQYFFLAFELYIYYKQ